MKENVRIRPAEEIDCPAVFELIKELALFEKAAGEVDINAEELARDAFGDAKIVQIFVAEIDGDIVGAALVYEKYSTWKGRCLHLEDLIVQESARGAGIGSLLFQEMIKLCKSCDYKRMEWQVLDWNEPAIEFYKKYGATFLDDWTDCRLTASDIKSFDL